MVNKISMYHFGECDKCELKRRCNVVDKTRVIACKYFKKKEIKGHETERHADRCSGRDGDCEIE